MRTIGRVVAAIGWAGVALTEHERSWPVRYFGAVVLMTAVLMAAAIVPVEGK